jgi:hypothetical protein
MIYQLAKDIAAGLHLRKWPVAVFYGKDRLPGTHRSTLEIRFDRDRESGDGVTYAQGAQHNPGKIAKRLLGVTLDVYAQAGCDGARQNEHEHLCDDLVDALITQLEDWGTASRAGAIDFTESRYLSSEEVNKSDVFNGVVYRLRFHVPRGVFRRDYTGAALPEGAPLTVTTTSRVTLNGTDYEDI